LPVVSHLQGKVRHQMLMPDGTRRFTLHASKIFNNYPAIVQVQVAQTALTELEIRLVARRHLTKDEEASLCREIQVEMGSHFVPRFVYLDAIPRSPVGKFETFRCEIV
jgi:hypothetical protein